MHPKIAHLLAGAAACVVAPSAVWAQTAPQNAPVSTAAAAQAVGQSSATLEEVIVTATKTGATRAQDTPIPISAFSGAQLAKTFASNINDLAQFTPSLNISLVTVNPAVTLRGVGTNNVGNGSDPDVTMQIDGVYIARPSAMATDFIDLDRVEVLRGPQGTLYGRNAVGGTINEISKTPKDAVEGLGAVTVGNYALVQTQGYVSGPLVPGRLQGSLSVTYTRHDDYEKNIVPGAQSGVANANHGGVRAQLRYEPTDWIDATTRADYLALNEHLNSDYHLTAPLHGAALADALIGDDTKIAINSPSTEVQHGGGVSEEINFRLPGNLLLKSISAWRANAFALNSDNDGTELNITPAHLAEDEQQWSQEVDLSGHNGPLDWVTGLYYFDEVAGTNVWAKVIPAGVEKNALPHFANQAEAAFGQGTYHLTPTISLTAGVRYTSEDKRIDSKWFVTSLSTGAPLPGPASFDVTRNYDAWTPKFGIDWKVLPTTLLYASATKGYKSGGTNYAATSLQVASFNPESLWSYEGGVKSDLFDRRLRVNLAGFYYDYQNMQLQSVLQPGVVSIFNAASASIYGVEAEISAKITQTFRLDANVSGLHTRYDSFPKAPVPGPLAPFVISDPRYNPLTGQYNATGKQLNQAPSFSGTIAAENDFPLADGATVIARADLYYQGRTFYEPTNAYLQSQGAYGVFNAELGYSSPSRRWQVTLFGKNLGDRRYLYAFTAGGSAPSGTAAAPRTFGIRFSGAL